MPDKTVGGEGPVSAEQRDSSKRRGKLIDKIIGLTLRLLFIENIDELALETSRIIVDVFPVKSLIFSTYEEGTRMVVPRAVLGYPEARIAEIKRIAIFNIDEQNDPADDASKPIGRFSRFYIGELLKNDPRERAIVLDTDSFDSPRKTEDSWHPFDRLDVRLLDRMGGEIGAIYITDTSTGKLLDEEIVEGLEVLASIVSVALELSRLKQREGVMLSVQERRITQITQLLAFSNSILTLADPKKLIDKTLELLDTLFEFQASSIAILDENDNCFRWRALRGYPESTMKRALSMRVPIESINSDTAEDLRIGTLSYFKPVEKVLPEDLPYFFLFERIEDAEAALRTPRKETECFHPLDNLILVILDSRGKKIGVICPDKPRTLKIPSKEDIEMMEVFVSLIAIAIENAHVYGETAKARDEVHILNRLMFHDLMNYSMAIRGYLDLAMATSDESSTEKYLDRAMKQIDQTAKLIEKVQKLTAIKSADKSNLMRIDLGRTISTQASKTAALFPTKLVKYSFNLGNEEAFVMANDLLPDLFHNIFMNAIKFDSHENVLIDVGLSKVAPTSGEAAKGEWKVSIADHGPGIPDEMKRSIFLGSHKPAHADLPRGMGLGLSIVKSLVDLYDGEIWVEDREQGHPEKGAVFNVQLPQA